MTRRDRQGRLPLVLFGLVFLSVGLGVLAFAVIRPAFESVAMRGWDERPARVLESGLRRSYSDDGSITLRAVADYRYRVDGVAYTGTRVGLHGGSDNIGSWQRDTARRLRDAREAGRDITVLVDPDDPRESVIDPRLRVELIGFLAVFALVFGGVSAAVVIGGLRLRDAPPADGEMPRGPVIGDAERV